MRKLNTGMLSNLHSIMQVINGEPGFDIDNLTHRLCCILYHEHAAHRLTSKKPDYVKWPVGLGSKCGLHLALVNNVLLEYSYAHSFMYSQRIL